MKQKTFISIILITFCNMVIGQNIIMQVQNSIPPPIGYTYTESKATTVENVVLEVPAYLWSYGCANTSAAMLVAYYDRNGFGCLYRGGINGGVAPLKNSGWKENNFTVSGGYIPNYLNSISGSKNGYDGRTVDGFVDDFFVFPNNSGDDPDPWSGGNPPHDFSMDYETGRDHCVGDFMGSSQDYWNNPDGATAIFANDDGSKLFDYFGSESNTGTSRYRDGAHGLKLFMEDGTGYSVDMYDGQFKWCYNQQTDNEHTDGFSFFDFQTEINQGRPVLVHYYGHTCTGKGYRIKTDGTEQIALNDTWSTTTRWMDWGADLVHPSSGQIMALKSVTVVKLYGHTIKSGYDFSCDPIVVGPYDDLYISDPPANTPFPPMSSDIMQPNTYNFSPGDNINFYAEFSSYYCNTFALTFNWKIELYHKSGTYEYMVATTQGYDSWPTACKSSSQWKATAPTNIPDYDWERNEDGTINGKIIVQTLDNTGYVNTSDEVYITVNYKPNKPVLTLLDSDERTMTFSFSSGGATSYKVYYGLSAFPPFSDASGYEALEGRSPISIGAKNTFSLTDINKHTTISVTGINEYGESNYSNTVTFAQYAALPYSTGFENNFDNYWTSEPSNDNGLRTMNTSWNGYALTPHSGSKCLTMATFSNGTYASNFADLRLNLQNEKDVFLEFWWKDYGDEYHSAVDGIWFSNDGGSSFIKVYDLRGPNYTNQMWTKHKIDLSSVADQNSMDLTKNCIVRFAQYDNYTIPSDGFSFDDISVYSNYTPPSPVTVSTHTATKDAMLAMSLRPGYGYVKDYNYGTYPMIKAEEWTSSGYRTNTKSVFQFDLSMYPVASTLIKSAYLSLYANDPQPSDAYKQMSNLSTNNSGYKSNACTLKRIVQEWDENTVTYSTEPQTTNLHAEYMPVSETYTESYLNFDVSRLVEDMIKYPDASHGFMMELFDETKYARMTFASSDHTNSSLHPRLSIEYYFDEPVYNIPFTVLGNTTSESNDWDVQGDDGKDKSYLVYIPSTITIDATTCASVTDYDTKLEIFKADKSRTGAYNDDNMNCYYSDYSAGLFGITLSPGYYYFVVDGYNGATGNFQLSVYSNSGLKSATTNEEAFVEETKDDVGSMIVLIYPNPVCDVLNLDLPEENTQIRIVGLNGIVLKDLNCTNTHTSIDCSDLIQGIYTIQVITSKSVEVRLFEKQ
ncbi:MAG: T9SS type A sorting domain-containing protein [Bacteroidales bacterium]|nr:T9SS type A sorting domain-containing protein [Bacteroidales bacterium]